MCYVDHFYYTFMVFFVILDLDNPIRLYGKDSRIFSKFTFFYSTEESNKGLERHRVNKNSSFHFGRTTLINRMGYVAGRAQTCFTCMSATAQHANCCVTYRPLHINKFTSFNYKEFKYQLTASCNWAHHHLQNLKTA